jgi:hypothetical protein
MDYEATATRVNSTFDDVMNDVAPVALAVGGVLAGAVAIAASAAINTYIGNAVLDMFS